MKAKSFLLSAIVISILFIQLTFAAPPHYEIIDLGTLGGIHSVGRSINDKGQVVGYSENSLGLERATLFDSTGNGNNIDLGTLDGQYSKANSINRDGQIVGQATNASGYWRATLFHPTGEGNNIELGTLGGDRSFASSINDNGQIVGCAQITSGELHATLFEPTGGKDNIDLGTLGGDESWASSINNSSQIVGTAYRLFTSPGGRFPPVTSSYPRATLFDPTGQGNNIDLGTLLYTYGVCCCSGAMSINDSGNIVGAAWNEDPFPFGQEMAVLFDPTGGEDNIFLGTLGRYGSFAYSINNRDQIIGWGGFCSNNLCGTRPALFDHTGQGNNVNLYDLIDPCCGWILKEVWSINDSGWIVGEGINPASKHHAFLLKPIPPKIIYVDDDATGADDGLSWADAFNYLQDALAIAWSGDEIHVARGIYKPDQGVGQTPGDREATFQLKNGVILKGGYAGTGAPDPNARDIELYETILSGDLAGNDIDVSNPQNLLDDPCRAENSYHVVTTSGTDEISVLDGFSITAGYANGDFDWHEPRLCGGGMYNEGGSPLLRNCTFRSNSAYLYGGGMYNYDSSPTLTNCTFTGNRAQALYTSSGGGICNYQSNSILTNCTFSDNSADLGGAMCNYECSLTMISCTFSENKAGGGGGMANWRGNPTLRNCTFRGNLAQGTAVSIGVGAGMCNGDSNSVLVNCVFSGNSARHSGGGMDNYAGNLIITNCTFSGNYCSGMDNSSSNPMITNCTFSGNYGSGMINFDSCPILTNCTINSNSASWFCSGIYNYYNSQPTLTNCILWNDSNEIWNGDNSTITITYSDVQGGWPGEGNIDDDPLFVELGYWDVNGTPFDANDDVWVDGDYHLLPGSPCIDTGDPNYIAGPNETDLDGRPRIINGRVDMGAYEYAPTILAEARILPRTINLASKGRWITCYIWLPDDYDVADIDSNSVFLERQIKAKQFSVDEQAQLITAKFAREKVQSILDVGNIKLTITCQLTDGNYFEATDIIQVIDKGIGQSAQ